MGNNGIFHFPRQAMRILAAALICLLLLQPSLALMEAEVQEAEMGPQVVLLLSENATERGIPMEPSMPRSTSQWNWRIRCSSPSLRWMREAC